MKILMKLGEGLIQRIPASFELKNDISSTALNGNDDDIWHLAVQGLGLCSVSCVQESIQDCEYKTVVKTQKPCNVNCLLIL